MLIFGTLFAVLATVASTQGLESRLFSVVCKTPGIVVSAHELVLARDICRLAEEVDAKLVGLGMHNDRRLLIEVTEAIVVNGVNYLALFDVERHVIRVLKIEKLEVNSVRKGPYKVLSPPLLFESLLVHELTHAYLHRSVGGRRIPRSTHEFVAFAIQLDRLPPKERDKVFRRAVESGQLVTQDLNGAILKFFPARFAAMSWLRFVRPDGGATIIQRILGGDDSLRSLRN